MEAGWAFDDTIFSEPKNSGGSQLPVSYTAKVCTDQWFNTADTSDAVEQLNVLKFRADHAYRSKQYDKALEVYQSCLDILPAGNMSMWRDILEGKARCHLAQLRLDTALQLALQIHAKAFNFEQQTSSYNLLAQVYKQLRHLPGWLDAVQALLTLHPMNPDLWVELAEVYKQCMNSPLCTQCTLASHQAVPHRSQVSGDSNSSLKLGSGLTEHSDSSNFNTFHPSAKTEPENTKSRSTCDVCTELCSNCKGHDPPVNAGDSATSKFNDLQIKDSDDTITRCQIKTCSTGMDLSLVIATCFLRARLLLENVEGYVETFAKERNLTLQQKVKREIKKLEISEEVSQQCIKFVGRDLYKYHTDQSADDGDVAAAAAAAGDGQAQVVAAEAVHFEDFEKKWFSWKT